MLKRTTSYALLALLGCGLASCTTSSGPPQQSETPSDPAPIGTDPATGLNASQQAQLQQLSEALSESRSLDADELLAQHALPHPTLGYEPLESEFLDTIQGSELALSEGELTKLGQN